MGHRGARSVSIKMILTTTLAIAVTVVGTAVLNVVNVRREIDEATERKIEVFRRARDGNGEFGTPLLGRAVQSALIDKGEDRPILETIRSTVAGDTKRDDGRLDYGLRFALVLDHRQGVVAHCFEDAALRCTDVGNHPPVGPELGTVTFDAWKRALAAWRDAVRGGGPALVQFDIAGDGASYRVFAYPVIVGAPATAAAALAPSNPDRQGYVVVGYDLAPIAWFADAAEEDKRAASQRAALYSGAVGALFVLIGMVLAILQGVSIARPIRQLARRVGQIARGDLAARVEVRGRDEIGQLGIAFNHMADQLAILLAQTAEKARLDQELEVARAIQEALIPSGEPVVRGNLALAGYYQPAAQTGGDWWTWHDLAGDRVLVVIGDVTGHGVPSAMITAAAKAACDVARHVHGDDVTVSRLLEIMNHAIWQSAQRRFVMTCFAAIIDPAARTITYANAGHNFPYVVRGGELGSLVIRGNRLGDDPASRYEARTAELARGDVIVLYTDGFVECDGPSGEPYGDKRLRAAMRRALGMRDERSESHGGGDPAGPAGGAGASPRGRASFIGEIGTRARDVPANPVVIEPAALRDAVIADAFGFYGDVPRKDDLSMVVARIA